MGVKKFFSRKIFLGALSSDQRMPWIIGMVLFELGGCGMVLEKRDFLQRIEPADSFSLFKPHQDFRVLPGEELAGWRPAGQALKRSPQGEGAFPTSSAQNRLTQEFQQLLRLQSDFSRTHYYRYQNHLGNISQRIYFLRLLTLEERNHYLRSKGVVVERDLPPSRLETHRRLPLYTGMTKEQVITAWGHPGHQDIAGDSKYQNERWTYRDGQGLRLIYFEGGVVQGWQLER